MKIVNRIYISVVSTFNDMHRLPGGKLSNLDVFLFLPEKIKSEALD